MCCAPCAVVRQAAKPPITPPHTCQVHQVELGLQLLHHVTAASQARGGEGEGKHGVAAAAVLVHLGGGDTAPVAAGSKQAERFCGGYSMWGKAWERWDTAV